MEERMVLPLQTDEMGCFEKTDPSSGIPTVLLCMGWSWTISEAIMYHKNCSESTGLRTSWHIWYRQEIFRKHILVCPKCLSLQKLFVNPCCLYPAGFLCQASACAVLHKVWKQMALGNTTGKSSKPFSFLQFTAGYAPSMPTPPSYEHMIWRMHSPS